MLVLVLLNLESMTKTSRKTDEKIWPYGKSLKTLVRKQTARRKRVGDVRDAERALRVADVARSLPAHMWLDPEKKWYVTATPEFPPRVLPSRLFSRAGAACSAAATRWKFPKLIRHPLLFL